MESSSQLSDKAVQKILKKLAPVLGPGENVRYVGFCLNFKPALSHFLITDTRIIGVEQDSVRFSHHGSELTRTDLDASKGSVTIAAVNGEPFTMKSVPKDDLPVIEGHLQRLRARTTTADAPPPELAPPPPPAPATPAADVAEPPPTGAPVSTEAPPTGTPVSTEAPEDAPPPSGTFVFDVVLTATGSTPIPLIKEVRRLTSLDLAAAKKLVEGPPWTILEGVAPARAQSVKATLEAAGATIELVASTATSMPAPTTPALDPTSGAPAVPATAGGGGAGEQRRCGGELWAAARRALADVSHEGETPWLILNPAGATGALVAFEDRLAIIKAGALTGFLAGSTFGGRQAVIYFVDITGIEYNSGLLNGVLEVLTASYQGSANKDFWQGTLSSRNADANDPFTLSNTLPMTKSEFRECQEHINELRRRIAEAKRPVIATAPAAAAPDSFADQIAKLAQLRADGLISDEEFAAAKRKLMQD